MTAFFRLLRFELAKLVRMRLARVLLLILSLETMAKVMGLMILQRDAQRMMNIEAGGAAGYMQALAATSFSAVRILSLVFASLLISGERTSGGLRYLCSLPFSRTAIIVVKILMLLVFMAAALGIVGTLNLAAAIGIHGLEPIEEFGYVLYTPAQVVLYYFQMHALAFVHLFALASLGLLVSVWSPNSGAAVAVTIVVSFGIVGIEQALGIEWMHYEALRYDAARGFESIGKGIEGYRWLGDPEIVRSLVYAAGYAAVFSVAPVASFLGRENYS